MPAKEVRKNLKQMPQRQDSAVDQIATVVRAALDHDISLSESRLEMYGLANRLGCYDAADYIMTAEVSDWYPQGMHND